MYQLYMKKETGFDSKSLISEYKDVDDAYARIDAELAKDEKFRYVLEETTGHINSYGELIPEVIEEN